MSTSFRLAVSIAALCIAEGAGAQTLFFNYVAADGTPVGYFSVDKPTLLAHIGEANPGFLSNAYLQELSFSYGALSWQTDDIDRSDFTIFAFDDEQPRVDGGSGSLAQLATMAGREGAITIFTPSNGTEFGYYGLVAGRWVTTSSPVPEHGPAALLICGLLALGLRVRGTVLPS